MRPALEELRNLARHYCTLWDLRPTDDLEGTLSCCLAVDRRDGSTGVLKIHEAASLGLAETRALIHWQGCGVPAVLEADPAAGAFLLERILPGHTVDASCDRSPEYLGSRLLRLYARPFHGKSTLPTLADNLHRRLSWQLESLRVAGRLDQVGSLRKVARQAQALCASASSNVLLHGDFLHKNLIVGPGNSLVILDPLVCFGDSSFDAAMISSVKRTDTGVAEYAERICGVIGCSVRRALAWTKVLDRISSFSQLTHAQQRF